MPRLKWLTLAGEGHDQHRVKKSVFVARAVPLESDQHADVILAQEKKEHRSAKHHVYAWRICKKQQMQSFSDDQEPAGTAGRPILDVLLNKQLDDAIIVVSRYFGGVLLGMGGLRRAYATAAERAVEQAGMAMCQTGSKWTVETDYEDADRLKKALDTGGYPILDARYAEKVCFDIFCKQNHDDVICQLVMEATSGRGMTIHVGAHTYKSLLSSGDNRK